MKRSVKNLFVVIMILVSLIASGIRVAPGYALGAMVSVTPTPGLPGGWNTGSVLGVSGSGPNDVYAVGYGAPIGQQSKPLFYDYDYNAGSGTWTPSTLPLGTWSSGTLEAVWSSGTNNIHAVGYGTSGSTTLPLLYHSTDDGANWTSFNPALPGTSEGQLFGVWGFVTGDVYAVGYGVSTSGLQTLPLLYHYTGSNWTASTLPLTWNHGFLMDVWGSSASDIYAVGYGNNGGSPLPLIYHTTNGTNWTQSGPALPTGWTAGYLYGVWGSGPNDVYAVGSGTNASGKTVPLLYHYDGNIAGTWTSSSPDLPSGWASAGLDSIWGSSADDVYLVGSGNNRALMYRKTSNGGWAASSYAFGWNTARFHDIWGSGENDVYAVGFGNNGGDYPLLSHAGLDGIKPGAVTSPNATPGTCNGSIKLDWTAPADDFSDPNSGPADSYLVRYSSANINSEATWNAATEFNSGLPVPMQPGTAQTMTVSGLTPGATYYVAIRARDEDLNLGDFVTRSAAAQTAEAAGTWYIYGVGDFVYGAKCDIPVVADYNGDGKDDIAIFRPTTSTWYIYGVSDFVYGAVGDIPVIADYNGDGKADIAVFRPTTSTWYIYGVGDFVYGTVGDIPVIADYNGDGKADIAVFRPTTSTWHLYGVGDFVYGTVGDIPAVADYNGDGKADIAVFRPTTSTWHLYGVGDFVYGTVGDIPVIADYNGDGKADIAVFRPTTSTWHIYGVGDFVYGTVGDKPVIADYNGDGKADVAVFR